MTNPKFNVNGYEWEITYFDDERHYWGHVSLNDQICEVWTGLNSHRKRVTTLHELIHAVMMAAGLRDDHNEIQVSVTAQGLVSLFEQNPHLIALCFEKKQDGDKPKSADE